MCGEWLVTNYWSNMSTAFLVENILSHKEEHDTILSDCESEANSDLKNSMYDSPRDEIPSRHSSLSSSDERDRERILVNNTEERQFVNHTFTMIGASGPSGDRERERVEMCCTKCGNYYPIINRAHMYTNSDGGVLDDFRCEKCGGNGEIRIEDSKETILKDNSKPVLKFSVSAILGDTKECVRVRNGKAGIDSTTSVLKPLIKIEKHKTVQTLYGIVTLNKHIHSIFVLIFFYK